MPLGTSNSTELRDTHKEFHTVNGTYAIRSSERSTHLVALQWSDQIPANRDGWAKLCNRRTLLLKLLDSVLAKGTLARIDRLGNSIGRNALRNREKFDTLRRIAAALLSGTSAGVE
jgi:hypothetical protein